MKLYCIFTESDKSPCEAVNVLFEIGKRDITHSFTNA